MTEGPGWADDRGADDRAATRGADDRAATRGVDDRAAERGQPRVRPFLAAGRPEVEPRHAERREPTGLRPFVLASGRVQSADPDIQLETQVTVRLGVGRGGAAELSRLPPELQAIVALCHEPISVAEISARLKLHLGVAKVLVADLRAAGHLDVHTRPAGQTHDADTILRVIRGLRGIS